MAKQLRPYGLFCYTLYMQYFLAKTDPSTYSINDFQKEKITIWNGVKNAQAVQALKTMKKGDRVLIYHSQGEGSIRGLAIVTKQIGQDPENSKSWLVELKLQKVFLEPFITLRQIKNSKKFPELKLVTQSRLSIMVLPIEFITWLKQQKLPV